MGVFSECGLRIGSVFYAESFRKGPTAASLMRGSTPGDAFILPFSQVLGRVEKTQPIGPFLKIGKNVVFGRNCGLPMAPVRV